MKKILFSATVLGGLLSAAVPAAAQSCSGVTTCQVSTTVSVTVPALVSLVVSGGGAVALTAPAVADLATGYVQDAGPTFTVKANRAWTLGVHTTAPTNWTYVGTQGGVKPISDLTWSIAAGGVYAAITTSSATIASGARTNGATPPLFFRTVYSTSFAANNNAQGAYSLPVVFTLSAP